MKIKIITEPASVDRKVRQAVASQPDATLIDNIIHFNRKPVASYDVTNDGVDVNVLKKPWYVSTSLIESKLRALFA